MATNANNLTKDIGPVNAFGSSGIRQTHGVGAAVQYPGHFQMPMPQAQAMVQTQAHAHDLAQALARFQAQQARALAQLHNAGTANIGVSSPSVAVAGLGSASDKLTSQKPPSKPPGASYATTASPFMSVELTPKARRKKQKLSDKQIQDKVAAILPKSAIYTQLLEFEARVDASLSLLSKKIDIQESQEVERLSLAAQKLSFKKERERRKKKKLELRMIEVAFNTAKNEEDLAEAQAIRKRIFAKWASQ